MSKIKYKISIVANPEKVPLKKEEYTSEYLVKDFHIENNLLCLTDFKNTKLYFNLDCIVQFLIEEVKE